MTINLGSIFKRYRWMILGTFMLLTIEIVLIVLYPLLMGQAINGRLNEQSNFYLYLFAAALFIHLIVGTARRLYDTRVYSYIYADQAPKMVASHQQKGYSDSHIAGRCQLLTRTSRVF